MRFRVWHNTKKIFDEGCSSIPDYCGDWKYVLSPNGKIIKFNDGYESDYSDDENLILCLSTGLKDKNGKEIYEGDIITYYETAGYFLVKFGEYSLIFEEDAVGNGFYVADYNSIPRGSFISEDCKHIEVVGNIYENPNFFEELEAND